MTKDSRKALEFSHNVLNLPMTASSLAGTAVTNTMTYTYLGDGTRVGARVSNPDAAGYSGMRYRGSFVYDVTADPLAHKYFGMSSYNYCGNDPVNKFDPDGRFIVTRDPENQQALFYNVEKQCFVDSNGNDYSGDNEYILNLTTQLTSLCNGESGMELVSSLVDSEKGVEITQGQKMWKENG